MRTKILSTGAWGTALSAILAAGLVAATPTPLGAQPTQRRSLAQQRQLPPGSQRPTNELLLSIGQGELIRLPSSVTDIWTSNPGVADVYVTNNRQINVFGKEFGEATVFATNASGAIVYSANVRVAQNITSVDRMLRLAMPDADITVTTVGQLAVLTGTVASPEDSAQAETLVKTALNPGVNLNDPTAELKMAVVSRLQTATPLQVNLQVKIAEVSREFSREIGVNLLSRDTTGGFLFGIAQGRAFGDGISNIDTSIYPKLDASSIFGLPSGSIQLPFDPGTGQFINPANPGSFFDFSDLGQGAGRTNLGLAGKLFGIDAAAALDLAENDGLVTTLAEPNLTALSGETASFLAGGEVPIPVSQALGTLSVEYKQYGVSLAFTPTVLADGRISMRVRPEVSQLSDAGAVRLNGFLIPGFTTRRAETTVELGSGQSFMIGGLLQNGNNNSVDKAPFLGDLPIIGALFRSTSYRRAETELVIIVTPYLVRPTSGQLALPTDGFRAPTAMQQLLGGQNFSGRSGARRPGPTGSAPVTVPPASSSRPSAAPAPTPGFSGN